MKGDSKRFVTAVSVLVGSCIGAGVLGIPYVAAQAGFFVALFYIFFIGGIILLVNLYLGEISLRTKGEHQLPGYAEKYLGKVGGGLMEFAIVFGIYSAIVAYTLGIGESIGFLIFKNSGQTLFFGILFGGFMSLLLWRGVKALKKYEKIGVGIILFLLLLIFVFFVKDVELSNLMIFNGGNIFLPFGVVLFALLSFAAVPEVEIILKNKEKMMKKVIIISTLACVVFYILFAFVVVGVKGNATPQIATLALGKIFVFLGIFTMFTSYLALGNALQHNFMFDERMKKLKAWFLTAIVPVIIFILTQISGYFSFTRILSISGVISGGLTGVLILLMVRKAKKEGDRKPEYSIKFSKILMWILILIFVLGVLSELI